MFLTFALKDYIKIYGKVELGNIPGINIATGSEVGLEGSVTGGVTKKTIVETYVRFERWDEICVDLEEERCDIFANCGENTNSVYKATGRVRLVLRTKEGATTEETRTIESLPGAASDPPPRPTLRWSEK